jgi:Ca-activated chloride channel family protein
MQQQRDSILRYDRASETGKIKMLDKKKGKKSPLKERKAESEDEQLSSDTEVKQLPTFGNRVTDETMSNKHTAKERKTPPRDFKLNQAQGETDIILRRSQNDPGEFLHRRFELQKKRDYPNVKPSKVTW